MQSPGFRDRYRIGRLSGRPARALGAAGLGLTTALSVVSCQPGGADGTNTIRISQASPKVATPHSGRISSIDNVPVSVGGPSTQPVQVAHVGKDQVVSPDVMRVGEKIDYSCLKTGYPHYDGVMQSIRDHNTGGFPNPEPTAGGGGATGYQMALIDGACFASDTLVGNQYGR